MKSKKWAFGAAITIVAVCLALAFNSCAFSEILETGSGESTATATVQTIESTVRETEPGTTPSPTTDRDRYEIPSDEAISEEEAIENAIDGMVEHGEPSEWDFENMFITTRYVANPPYDDCPLWVVVFSTYYELVDGDRYGNVTSRIPEITNFYVKLNALTGEYIHHTASSYYIDLSETMDLNLIIDARSYLYN